MMRTKKTPVTHPGPAKPKYTDIAEYLRTNPGTWVYVRTANTDNGAWAAAQQIKDGRRAAFRPAGHYSAFTEGRNVYASYTGACHTGALGPGEYCTACGTVNAEGEIAHGAHTNNQT